METIAAFIAGATAKIYDDGIDSGNLTDEFQKKIVETLLCFLLGGISINNFMFTVSMIIVSLVNHVVDKEAFKNPYEFSLLAVSPIFLLLSISTRTLPTSTDILLFLFIFSILSLEPIFIKEDVSARKVILRFLLLIIFITCISINLSISQGLFLVILYFSGYMFVSFISQLYSVSHMPFADFVDEAIDGFKDLFSSLSLSLPPSLNVTTA